MITCTVCPIKMLVFLGIVYDRLTDKCSFLRLIGSVDGRRGAASESERDNSVG
jgi:hypothetical protein